MTPTEWGRLQGFIGYGFIDSQTGKETFAFPKNVPESQQYKQFGNAVSIPVIETMAEFIYKQLSVLNKNYEVVLKNLDRREGGITRKSIAKTLQIKPENASYILRKLEKGKKINRTEKGRSTKYYFVN